MDEAAVGADEGIGRGVLPFGLHAQRTGGLESDAPSVEFIPFAVMAAKVPAIDLNSGGFGRRRSHDRSDLGDES
jgi:hypothetical protein